ncbi:MAG: glycosyltransferase family A protein [Pseudomonadota bacterium]
MFRTALHKATRRMFGRRMSIIVIMYNMRREAHRTLHSLTKAYQWGVDHLDYEVIVVDNGSSEPVEDSLLSHLGPQFRHMYIEDAHPSPANAINRAVEASTGDIVCIMIDGAHILTPGILHYADFAFRIYKNPVVAPHYFFLGPGQQSQTVFEGYNQEAEDALLASINWPEDGYRLFKIGQIIGQTERSWFMRKFEGNCLFLYRKHFENIGGCDERFDLPGGGFLNPDLYDRALTQGGATSVCMIGEGTFHQVHGGTTTNISRATLQNKLSAYRKQYEDIRGKLFQAPNVPVEYIGHMPIPAAIEDVLG